MQKFFVFVLAFFALLQSERPAMSEVVVARHQQLTCSADKGKVSELKNLNCRMDFSQPGINGTCEMQSMEGGRGYAYVVSFTMGPGRPIPEQPNARPSITHGAITCFVQSSMLRAATCTSLKGGALRSCDVALRETADTITYYKATVTIQKRPTN